MNTFLNNLERLKAFKVILEKEKSRLTGQITVKSGLGLVRIGVILFRLVCAKAPTKSTVRVLKHFFKECYRITKCSGLDHLIKYLKTCSVLLQQNVAKHSPQTMSHEISKVKVATTRTGLPRIIPRVQRVLIRKGHVETITFWLSLFNLYRFLNGSHSYVGWSSTITSPGVGWVPNEDFFLALEIFKNNFLKFEHKKFPTFFSTLPKVTQTVSVTVNEAMQLRGTSLFAFMTCIHQWRSLANWYAGSKTIEPRILVNRRRQNTINKTDVIRAEIREKKGKFLEAFINWVKAIQPKWFMALTGPMNKASALSLPNGMRIVVPNAEIINRRAWLSFMKRPNLSLLKRFLSYPLGRLVRLPEAAGKVRVIAIVDPLTQEILKPLHLWLFSVLREIPQDGTFEQDRPLKLLLEQLKKKNDKFIGCADMSAATDRLPAFLQKLILGALLNNKNLATAWHDLLTCRPYQQGPMTLYYKVGQPMGALSSWAMLAVTHHFLWQWAAMRSGVVKISWFKDYAVLGDDSAVSNRIVLQEYLTICKEIGVGIGLAKSLLSPIGAIEFAKRFYTPKGNCSPCSIGQIAVSFKNFSTLASWPLIRSKRPADTLFIYGKGYRALGSLNQDLMKQPKRTRNLLLVLYSPWGPLKMHEKLSQWLCMDKTSRMIQYPGLPILILINKLRLKAVKVVDSQNMAYKMSGISGTKSANLLTEKVRNADPQTYRVLMDLFFEPVRKHEFFAAVSLLIEAHKAEKELSRVVFYVTFTNDIQEYDLDFWFEKFQALETKFNLLSRDSYEQVVDKPFVPPSPRSVSRLWNSFRES